MRKIVYVHNPKTGSTSIRRTLGEFGLRTPKRRHIHLPIHDPLVDRQIDDNTFVFVTVRHPLERAVSAFNFWARPRKRTTPEFWVLQSLASGMDVNQFYRALDLPLAARIVPHFQRQFSFIEKNEERVDRIVKLEEIAEEWPKILSEIGIDRKVKLRHDFKTIHRRWDQELTHDVAHKLEQFYVIDFEKFGYE